MLIRKYISDVIFTDPLPH